MLNEHVFRTGIEWSRRRAGWLKTAGLPPLEVSAPPEFNGDAGVWTPEHLLVGATASCLMTTFLAIADLWGLAVLRFQMEAEGKIEKVPGEGHRFTQITLRPEVEVGPEDEEKVRKVLAKAEQNCFVKNSLRAAVRVEPRILVAAAEAARVA